MRRTEHSDSATTSIGRSSHGAERRSVIRRARSRAIYPPRSDDPMARCYCEARAETERRMHVKHGTIVLFWWFMIVSQYPGGTLSAATQGPFGARGGVRNRGAVRMGPPASWTDDRPSGRAGRRLGLEPVLERRALTIRFLDPAMLPGAN